MEEIDIVLIVHKRISNGLLSNQEILFIYFFNHDEMGLILNIYGKNFNYCLKLMNKNYL